MASLIEKTLGEDIEQSSVATAPFLYPVEPNHASARLMALIADLNVAAVAYCFWKGSHRLAPALAGDSDLDLLVARVERDRIWKILTRHEFKYWPDISSREHPAMMSFLGYDEANNTINHVHVHFGLVFGDSLLKSYRLPGEESFIGRSVYHPVFPVRVLDPADEALLLIVRVHFEMRWFDVVAGRNRGALRQKNAVAVAELASRVSQTELHDRAAEIFSNELASEMAVDFAVGKCARSNRRMRLAISKELVARRMYGGLETGVRTIARSVRFAANAVNKRYLRWPRPWGRRAPGGGIVIAFVGVDGSGKSTQVSSACQWLGREADVISTYFGTGDGRASLMLMPLKALAPVISRFIKIKPAGASHGNVSDRPPGLLYSLLFAVWATAVALEKRHKIISSRRAASRGFIVIADRYPQNEILEFNDGPRLTRLPYAPNWLRRFEASVYALAHRTPPDLVVKLHVGPDAVQAREPEMSPRLVAQRIAWLEQLKFPGARVISVDARVPLQQVTRTVRREIWKVL